MVTYVDAAGAVTVMRVLFFVLHACMLRECDGNGNSGMVVVSAVHVGGTRGSGIVSSAADVLGMSVVRGMRGVGRVCEMCMARVAYEESGMNG